MLRDEVQEIPLLLEDIIETRQKAAEKIKAAQLKQKYYFDKKRKRPRNYKEGDLVVIMKQTQSTGTSRKLAAPYSGPMVVKTILLDNYVLLYASFLSDNLRSPATVIRQVMEYYWLPKDE